VLRNRQLTIPPNVRRHLTKINTMRLFSMLFFILLLITIYSCDDNTNRLNGDWREVFNDSVVYDYNFSIDTVSIKSANMNWFEQTPYFIKNQTYFSKTDSSLILKIISQQDSDNFNISSLKPFIGKLTKLKNRNAKMPSMIKFDLISFSNENDSNLIENLGEGDYNLDINGSYAFYTHKKIYNGHISDSLLKQLKFYLSAIDSNNNNLTNHYFEIHLQKMKYRLEFLIDTQKYNYLIEDKQPVELTRVTFCLEKIWYEILTKSGYRIL